MLSLSWIVCTICRNVAERSMACSIAALIATLAERTCASSIAARAGQAHRNIPTTATPAACRAFFVIAFPPCSHLEAENAGQNQKGPKTGVECAHS
jgi:hypothetical protein